MKQGRNLTNMKKSTKSNGITYIMLLVVFIVVQIMTETGSISNLMKGLLVPACIYVIMAVSLNLTVGILGELSLGHAGFMCVGAYAGSFFSVCMRDVIESEFIRFPIAIIIGGLVAALFGFVVGIPVLRLRGDYLAIVTLAFGEIIKNFMNVLYIGKDANGFHFSMKGTTDLGLEPDGRVIIKGALGITGTPRDSTFIIAFILVVITVFVVLNMVNSRQGRAIMSIRDNRIAAESIGINITKYKLMAFVVSAMFAGIAGVLYSHNITSLTATTNNFGYNMSIMVLVYVVLGGIGNIRGSVIAAVILTILPEMLREFSDYRMLVYSLVLIFMMLFSSSPAMVAFREKHSLKGKFSKNKSKKEKGVA